ncbi:MAG: hypothetical protein AAF657_10845 [Acidobacteriota bacterium]
MPLRRDGDGKNTLSVLTADRKIRNAPTGTFLTTDTTFPSGAPDWVLWTAP